MGCGVEGTEAVAGAAVFIYLPQRKLSPSSVWPVPPGAQHRKLQLGGHVGV